LQDKQRTLKVWHFPEKKSSGQSEKLSKKHPMPGIFSFYEEKLTQRQGRILTTEDWQAALVWESHGEEGLGDF